MRYDAISQKRNVYLHEIQSYLIEIRGYLIEIRGYLVEMRTEVVALGENTVVTIVTIGTAVFAHLSREENSSKIIN